MKTFCVITCLSVYFFSAAGQKPNWQNQDLRLDSVFGISIERAYKELLNNKTPVKVIVAVIDNGIDTSHEDLKTMIWTNTKEIAGNGKDDDHNGFADDLHGWNFLGSESGLEDLTNLASWQKSFYDSLSYTKVPQQYQSGYQSWRKMWIEYNGHIENANTFMAQALDIRDTIKSIARKIGKPDPLISDFENYHSESERERLLCKTIIHQLPRYRDFKQYMVHELDSVIINMEYHNSHGLNMESDIASVQGNPALPYGDNDVCGPFTLLTGYQQGPFHGTHVAGIIAGNRNNGIGIQGICNNVQIMPVRVMSFYRELRDLDLANAIRYAVDNGARVINLSFGKYYTYNKKDVDAAIKYAMAKDLLIVHGAGNAGINIDKPNQLFYPNKYFSDSSGYANNWITVGASTWKDDSSLVAPFSNYGRNNVDVFAPGVIIYSTVPMSEYKSESGTSMAAPVVAALCALIWEYYPTLKAAEIKDIIMKSVIRPVHKIQVRDEGAVKNVPMSEICVSGGIVNAFNALKLAERYVRNKK